MVAPVAVCSPFGARNVGPGTLVDLAVVDLVVLDSVLDLVAAEDVRRLHRELIVEAAVALFVEADAAGHRRSRPGLVGHRPLIDRRSLDRSGSALAHRTLPTGSCSTTRHRSGPSDCDRRTSIELNPAVVGFSSALPRCGPFSPVRWVAEKRRVEAVHVRQLERRLGRVRHRAAVAVRSVRESREQRVLARRRRRHQAGAGVPRRIDRAEEEQAILPRSGRRLRRRRR